MKRMPVIFLGHGDPMIALRNDEITCKIHDIGDSLIKIFGKPKGILSISAHWYTRGSFVQTAENPEQIYDMYGFPNELYEIKYPVKGNLSLSNRVLGLLENAKINNDWGIDHGTWTVLVHMFLDADIPVVQLSVDGTIGTDKIFQLGNKLSSLRDEGYLIIGSGNIVHNLRLLEYDNSKGSAPAYDFNDYIVQAVKNAEYDKIINYKKNPIAAYAVPTPDHYLPLLYCLGASSNDDVVTTFNNICTQGSISMASFAFGL